MGESSRSDKLPPRKGKGKRIHPNSHAREVILQGLYQVDVVNQPIHTVLQFGWLNEPLSAQERIFAEKILSGVVDRWEVLDDVIRNFSSKQYRQISSVVRCIIRMGLYEIMLGERDPAIVIDDLVDLTRKYDGDESTGFVNGILDSFEKERREDSGSSPSG